MIKKFSTLLAVVTTYLFSSFGSQGAGAAPCASLYESTALCRPLTTEILRFSWEEDLIKPLAPKDFSGWSLANDILIGAYNDKWIGGFSFKSMAFNWWFSPTSPIASPLSIFGSWAILGLQDGNLVKIDTVNGSKLWENQISHFPTRKASLSGNDLFVFTSGQQLFSINFQSGKTNWIYDASSPVKLMTRDAAPPLAANGIVYVGSAAGEIHAIDQATGNLLWKTLPNFSNARFKDIVGELILAGEKLIIARSDGTLAALSITNSGNTLWVNHFSGISTIKQHEGVIYIGTLSGELTSIDALSGKQIWSIKIGQPTSSITIGDKVIYIAGTRGRITALSREEKGAILWSDDLEMSIDHDPIVFDGKIYFISPLKLLYGYKLL